MFDPAGLEMFAQNDGFTVWVYHCGGDGVDDLISPGYFDAAAALMRDGDMVVAVIARAMSHLLHVAGIDEDGVEVESLTPGGLLLPPALA